MRTIKFRAWIPQLRKMEEVTYLNWVLDEKTGSRRIDPCTNSARICDTDMVLMQFTGLLDKNSKEIYEGDIVEVNKKTVGIVEYTKRACFAVRWNLSNGLTVKKTLFWATEKGCEVIGNIYENPELDKVEK